MTDELRAWARRNNPRTLAEDLIEEAARLLREHGLASTHEKLIELLPYRNGLRSRLDEIMSNDGLPPHVRAAPDVLDRAHNLLHHLDAGNAEDAASEGIRLVTAAHRAGIEGMLPDYHAGRKSRLGGEEGNRQKAEKARREAETHLPKIAARRKKHPDESWTKITDR